MTVEEALPQLVNTLLNERGETGIDMPQTFEDQWGLFRALCNTRQPMPASERFLEMQDQLLQQVTADKGVTEAGSIEPSSKDSRLAVWQGDITTLEVDAIVNAANDALLGCWVPGHYCIDNAIHTYAGVQLRIECDKIMRAQGHREPTGAAKITSAFNLPSRYVIHTVGPIIQDGHPTPRQREQLASCYTSCLDCAEQNGCKDIAFCCISTGVFGFPQADASGIAIATVREWLDAHPGSSVGKVVFNTFLDKDTDLYRAQLG